MTTQTTWKKDKTTSTYSSYLPQCQVYATAYKQDGSWVLTLFAVKYIAGIPTADHEIDSTTADTLAECKGIMSHYDGQHVDGKEPLTAAIANYYKHEEA